MKSIVFFVVLLFSSNLFSLTLKLKDNPVITGEKVILSKVAVVVSDKENKWKDVKGYKLGNFPLSSHRTVIPLARLINISKDLNLTFENLKPLSVRRNVKKLTSTDFFSLASDYILTRKKYIKVLKVNAPSDVFIPISSKLVVNNISSKTFCGNFPMTFVAVDNSTGKKIKYINLRVTTIAKLKVAVAERDIKKGEKLDLTNIRFEEREFKNLRRNPLTVSELKNIMSKSTIKSGNIVFSGSYEEIPAVYKNKEVVVFIKESGLVMEMVGIAKENGTIGSLVRVFNPNSRKIIKAVVIGDNRAKIL